MPIDRVGAVFQGREVPPLDGFFKRSFQSFNRAEEIKRLSVLRKLLQTRLSQQPRLPGQGAKLIDDLWIGLVLAV